MLHEQVAHNSDIVLSPKEYLQGRSAPPQPPALVLMQEGLRSRRLGKAKHPGSPLENQPQMLGLPKIVVVIVADVLAMLCFLGCIPLMLVLSKRRQPMA